MKLTRKLGIKTSLKKQIQTTVQNLSVDVFGYEKIAQQNLFNYLKNKSLSYNVPLQQVGVRIYNQEGLHYYCYHTPQTHHQITANEVVYAFVGDQIPITKNVINKGYHGILSVIQNVAEEHHLNSKDIRLCIQITDGTAAINAFNSSSYLQCIPIGKLIKYFL